LRNVPPIYLEVKHLTMDHDTLDFQLISISYKYPYEIEL
jgi:hypothetical protein